MPSQTVIRWACLIGVAAFGIAATMWNETPLEERSVVQEWNETIARLGIEPVFPPEEDIHVGDVFAVIKEDRRFGSDVRQRALLNRAIKLDHVDMENELRSNYARLPMFSETSDRPDSADKPWPTAAKDDVFGGEKARRYVLIAAFPGFTIRHQRSASAGLAFWYGTLGLAERDDDVTSIRIPVAETYGVPSTVASDALKLFCEKPEKRFLCSDAELRRHLGFVAKEASQRLEDNISTSRYLVDVEIALVNRIYQTRSIEQRRRLGRNQEALIRAALAAADEPPAPPVEDRPTEAGKKSSRSGIQQTLRELDKSVPGGLISVLSSSGLDYELKQTFHRPVVIGYRAVRMPSTVTAPALTKEQSDALADPDQQAASKP